MLSKLTSKKFFITGTDTGVGKTTVTTLLLSQLKRLGYSVIACKPIASGMIETVNGLQNEDAANFLQLNSIKTSYQQINPFCFNLPVSPNIADLYEQKNISITKILQKMQAIFSYKIDFMLIEGVGGWKVPINGHETTADLAHALNIPIILVVGIRLGCLNHALLTYDAIMNSNLAIAGWVASCIAPQTLMIEENIVTLQKRLNIPFLGVLPYQNKQTLLDNLIDVQPLINFFT
jgi:dethiobiotin synthetase